MTYDSSMRLLLQKINRKKVSIPILSLSLPVWKVPINIVAGFNHHYLHQVNKILDDLEDECIQNLAPSSLLVATRDKSPYHVLITHGFVLDDQGKKMSKSLGNVIIPSMITEGTKHGPFYPGYGVDCLRSWIFSTDYTTDVSVGPVILGMRESIGEFTVSSSQLTIFTPISGKINDSLKKIRNTLRFILGNLFDFTPTDLIAYEKLSNVGFPSRRHTSNFPIVIISCFPD